GRACARGNPRPRAPRTGPGVEEGACVRIRLWLSGFSPLASKADLGPGPGECFSEGFRSARRLRRPMRAAVQAISRKTMCEVQPGGREPEMMQKHDLGGLEGVQPLGDRTLAVGCLVLVDDALADSLVQGAGSGALLDDGLLDVPGFSGQTEPADGGLQRRTNRLVADTGLLVLPVALDLRLDVRHAKTCSS